MANLSREKFVLYIAEKLGSIDILNGEVYVNGYLKEEISQQIF